MTGATPHLSVALPSLGADARVWMRDLCGADEHVVRGTDTVAAIALVDRLLVTQPGAAYGPGDAAKLTCADRDQALAALCCATFGDRVDGTRICERCGERFDLELRLSDLAGAVWADCPPAPGDGVHTAADGTRFRLPTGEDELAVWGLSADDAAAALLSRCVVEDQPVHESSAVLSAMERVGPTLDLDLDAACSECGHPHAVAFSVQAWVLGHLEQSRPHLLREIHVLARAYGWSLDDILRLPRQSRLALVELVELDQKALAGGLG
ncbi:MAG TPA: hypothetical protein VFG83_15035 [Kofleriaceae bacterium]|nr:hypothetical protein [Kofleriaceae bacterium]